ncbi:hypothetical protein C2845_PM11G27430 [Panicum miliaceum]|uniref:WPP domain-containing protein n=1 Tax=Panicum miliaceum TaxID=4540 RepID=A0A3L6RPV2_PANMI|nr:hypothetical protein C2845_PM11G27430 [Panicum miliaceum]
MLSSFFVSLAFTTHNKLEDAPNAEAEGTQPAPPQGSADAAPPASGAKAAEAPLLLLSIWPPSKRMRDAIVRCLMQMLAAPNVLSQGYATVPELEAEAFAAAHEFTAGASPEGIQVLNACSKEVSCRLLELAKSRPPPRPTRRSQRNRRRPLRRPIVA